MANASRLTHHSEKGDRSLEVPIWEVCGLDQLSGHAPPLEVLERSAVPEQTHGTEQILRCAQDAVATRLLTPDF